MQIDQHCQGGVFLRALASVSALLAQETSSNTSKNINIGFNSFLERQIDQHRQTPVLLEAIKEQQDMIEGQQKEIKELQGRLKGMDAMEARLQRIEAALRK